MKESYLDVIIRKLRESKIVSLIPKNSLICDLGCGSGKFLYSIACNIKEGIGVDRNIEHSKLTNLTFIKADLEKKIKLPSNKFDMVTCLAVLEHLNKPENLIKEAYRILKIMKEAGCHSICYGIESADETILKNIQKFIDLNKAREIIKLTKEVGIEVRISLMFGNPGETEETMEKTIQFALETDPDVVLFNIATAYPGTEMYTEAKSKGYLIEREWEEYDLANYTLQLPNLSEEKIKEYYNKAYRRFYLRPSYLLRRLSKIRSFIDIKENIEAFKGIFSFVKA